MFAVITIKPTFYLQTKSYMVWLKPEIGLELLNSRTPSLPVHMPRMEFLRKKNAEWSWKIDIISMISSYKPTSVKMRKTIKH